ncbi:MAG TPA: MFS transporter [Steroidobacteraceae bacterium]|nr:MFS transporter [Steroidobacteraceae bacterium]
MTDPERGWPRSLAGAVVGSAAGVSALLLYTNGLFVAGLAHDYGLTRVQFGFGVLLVTMALAAANPLVGWLADRVGAKWLSVGGLLLLSLGFASLGAFIESVNSYFLLQAAVAFAGAASGPIAYSKIINETFNRHRGIALGLTMTGIGIAAAIIPPQLAGVIAERGWRSGYYLLALVPLCGAVLTAVLLPARHAVGVRKVQLTASDVKAEAQWIRSPVFWMLAGTFAMMSLSFAGLLPHFVPLLGDAGLDPRAAGRVAGEIGLAVIASRMVVGYLLDRIFAPRIAILICLIAAGGSLMFLFNGVSSASITAIALGLALGAELDLMGFLIARYFGLAQFGRIYGWLYFAFVFASGLGPLWVGAVRDATGNYSIALAVSAGGLLVTCIGFLLMPRYPQQAGMTEQR